MKTADEITKLSEEALEMIASDNSVPVPGNLADSLDAAIIASELGRTHPRVSGVGRICVAAGFAAASLLAFVILAPRQPEDTFDDPAQAYAHLQKTFAFISSTMEDGFDIADRAEPALERTADIFSGIK